MTSQTPIKMNNDDRWAMAILALLALFLSAIGAIMAWIGWFVQPLPLGYVWGICGPMIGVGGLCAAVWIVAQIQKGEFF